jgi:hypothetical protein
MTKQIIECEHSCWCGLCKSKISAGEPYFVTYKRGWGAHSASRINVCAMCILGMSKDIKTNYKKKLEEIKTRRLLEVIEEK